MQFVNSCLKKFFRLTLLLSMIVGSSIPCAGTGAGTGTGTGTRKVDWGMGLGFESRMSREINPEYNEFQNVGQVYAKVRYWPWSLLAEYGQQEEMASASGTLRVATTTTTVGLWGRYEILGPDRWTPYLTTGLGYHFDEVRTRFMSETDVRNGQRGVFGIGGGLAFYFWRYVETQVEARMMFVEEQREPDYSGLVRVGLQF